MNKLYLLGYPLGHSVSPAMQNAALAATGLDDWRYEPLPLTLEELRKFLRDRRRKWVGANVTIPYKQAVIPLLDELSETAQEIGAVNTIVRRDSRLVGHNTDADGFAQALLGASVPLRNARVLIFGAGGGARAAAWALAREGVAEIGIVNRSAERAWTLVDWLNGGRAGIGHMASSADIQNADVVINATSLGMAPRVEGSPLDDGIVLKPGTWVMDMVYNPVETRFLKQARRCGARAIRGVEMLARQGALSFELWTGQRAPVDIMRQAALSALGERTEASEEKC